MTCSGKDVAASVIDCDDDSFAQIKFGKNYNRVDSPVPC